MAWLVSHYLILDTLQFMCAHFDSFVLRQASNRVARTYTPGMQFFSHVI